MSIGEMIRESQVWKSVFRHPAPRIAAIASW